MNKDGSYPKDYLKPRLAKIHIFILTHRMYTGKEMV